VSWQTFSLRFNQQFSNAYLYLDKCGEYMSDAIEEFDLMPGEVLPTGAQLVLPEEGLQSQVNPNFLEVIQEAPSTPDMFLKISLGLASLSAEHFGSPRLDSNCFEIKMQVPMASEEAAGTAMLKMRGDSLAEVSKALDMSSESRRIDHTFASGSQRLRLVINPVAYETIRVHRHNPVLMATASQKKRAQRLTKAADRSPQYPPYAIFLELALIEYEPAPNTMKELFDSLLKKSEIVKSLYKSP
jgi:hypothetical protein